MTAASGAPRLPDFIIAGTQKAGTTWLERNLARSPLVFTPGRQLHFFDRHFERGPDWYAAQFGGAAPGQTVGEKTTEYFDTVETRRTARRIHQLCPDCGIIIILRDPVARAFSALVHAVSAGLIPLPDDPDAALFDDMGRAGGQRLVERGFYARQLDDFFQEVPREKALLLVFEEDVIEDPQRCAERVGRFLRVPEGTLTFSGAPVNKVKLSRGAIGLSHRLKGLPYARGVIRRVDGVLGTAPWKPRFRPETARRLAELYAEDTQRLFGILGRPIPSWSRDLA